jgi:hypothetical protein
LSLLGTSSSTPPFGSLPSTLTHTRRTYANSGQNQSPEKPKSMSEELKRRKALLDNRSSRKRAPLRVGDEFFHMMRNFADKSSSKEECIKFNFYLVSLFTFLGLKGPSQVFIRRPSNKRYICNTKRFLKSSRSLQLGNGKDVNTFLNNNGLTETCSIDILWSSKTQPVSECVTKTTVKQIMCLDVHPYTRDLFWNIQDAPSFFFDSSFPDWDDMEMAAHTLIKLKTM